VEINVANLLVPSLPGLLLLFLEVVFVMTVGKFLLNKYFPGSGFTTLVNAA
jgi:hypothetical protein